MARTRSSIGFFLIFGTFWMGIVGVFDGLIGFNMHRQVRAERFPTVPGVVTASEITSHHDSDGTTYRPEVHFTYEVEGRTYTADTYRFGSMSSSDHGWASKVVDRYPAGAAVDVHYDPGNPSRAILETGIASMDIFLLLFLTPFNLVGLGIWTGIIAQWRRRMTSPEAGGVPILRRQRRVHLRLPRLSPLFAAGITALATSFIAIFIVAFTFGFDPPFTVLGVVWSLVIAPAIVVYFHRRFVVGSGAKDLVIDDETGTLSLPQTFGRKEDIILDRDVVRRIEVETVAHRGDKGGTSYTYAPTLVSIGDDGADRRDRLADWYDEARARDFAAWLTRKLDLDAVSDAVAA